MSKQLKDDVKQFRGYEKISCIISIVCLLIGSILLIFNKFTLACIHIYVCSIVTASYFKYYSVMVDTYFDTCSKTLDFSKLFAIIAIVLILQNLPLAIVWVIDVFNRNNLIIIDYLISVPIGALTVRSLYRIKNCLECMQINKGESSDEI